MLGTEPRMVVCKTSALLCTIVLTPLLIHMCFFSFLSLFTHFSPVPVFVVTYVFMGNEIWTHVAVSQAILWPCSGTTSGNDGRATTHSAGEIDWSYPCVMQSPLVPVLYLQPFCINLILSIFCFPNPCFAHSPSADHSVPRVPWIVGKTYIWLRWNQIMSTLSNS